MQIKATIDSSSFQKVDTKKRRIEVVIDSSIHFDPKQLPTDLLEKLLDRLKVPNPAKKIAEREMLYGARNIPSYIELWKWNYRGELILPRGFLWEFEKILSDVDINIEWQKDTVYYHHYDILGNGWCFIDQPEISLRLYQEEALDKIELYCGGIYKASTGSGKTRVMLELIRSQHQPTIVLCEKTDIATQWINFAKDLGFESVGMIGQGKWEDDKELVIALRQSIYPAVLAQEWYSKFGMVVVDECHHLVSFATMYDLVQRFPAYYRYGCSATPDSDPEIFPIARAVLGPVVMHSTPDEIGEHLIKPSVKVVKTDFEFDYRPTFRSGRKVVRNNYNDMIKGLEEDSTRNILITGTALQEALEGHCCLIISKRKNHLECMAKEIQNCINALCEEWNLKGIKPTEVVLNMLTGDNSGEYSDIADDIESYECGSVLFSTLADEGTDIPRLDRLFLAYPGRKLRGYEQAIGRIMRPHPKKKDAIVYDFRDTKVSLLNSQFRERCQGIYNKKGYNVETTD